MAATAGWSTSLDVEAYYDALDKPSLGLVPGSGRDVSGIRVRQVG